MKNKKYMIVVMAFCQNLIFESALSRGIAPFSFKPYYLIFCIDKGIREKIRYTHFLLRLLLENKGFTSKKKPFSSKPYSLAFCINKGIREKIRYAHFLLRLLLENKGFTSKKKPFSSRPYSLAFCINKGIREKIRRAGFLLRRFLKINGWDICFCRCKHVKYKAFMPIL